MHGRMQPPGQEERPSHPGGHGVRARGETGGRPAYLSNRLAVEVLQRAGISPVQAVQFDRQARRNGTSMQQELLASARFRDFDYFRAIATVMGIEMLDHIEPGRLIHAAP